MLPHSWGKEMSRNNASHGLFEIGASFPNSAELGNSFA